MIATPIDRGRVLRGPCMSVRKEAIINNFLYMIF
ncbi:MAG: hypothetical protein ACI90V_013627, partial [Bacillariaceae sp.]